MHIQRYPAATLLSITFALSVTGLGLSPGGGPSFISTTALLTTILVYTTSHQIQRYLAQWLVLTLSITLSHLGASLSALSSPSMSIISLSLLSAVSALSALVPIYVTHVVSPKLQNYRILLFPTFWTLTWLFVSRVSPIGRLLTWTPLTGISSYAWILPIFGLPGIDFISALWASTVSEYFYDLSVDESPKDEALLPDFAPLPVSETATNTKSYGHSIFSLAVLLAATLPSFYINPFPFPPYSDAANNTPLGVACILPPPIPSSSSVSQLDQFIKESKKYVPLSKVILWPEGAVIFESEAAKDQALSRIHEDVFRDGEQKNVWLGVSFLQRVGGDEKTGTRDGKYKNGMMLVGADGVEFTYYKRNLVPIAESFGQISSSIAPPLHTIEVKQGHELKPVTLTASICLDFSSPIFPISTSGNNDESQTPSTRPSLILAPARTWDAQVGEAMYSLARIRAKEVGAELLWCDGGAGGLSGVGDDIQVGWGSWAKVIGVPNESNGSGSNATVYATLGDFGAIILIFGVWGVVYAVSPGSLVVVGINRLRDTVGNTNHSIRDWMERNIAAIRGRIRERIAGNRTTTPLLIQIDEEEEERLI